MKILSVESCIPGSYTLTSSSHLKPQNSKRERLGLWRWDRRALGFVDLVPGDKLRRVVHRTVAGARNYRKVQHWKP